jgi:drug/metabolite transporter (DMT)-like permease
LRLVGLATSVACLCCVLQFIVLRPLSAAVVVPEVLGLSLINALVCTVAPVLMIMMAMERLGPALVSQVGMIGPLSTMMMGALLLGEPLTPWVLAGTVLVLSGIYVFTRSKASPLPD